MKRVLVAVGNEVLLNQIKKCGKYDVYTYDIDTKENVLEYLSKYNADVLITKDTLTGKIGSKDYIKEIRKLNRDIKIIICVKELDQEYKGFLLANNIFNILEGEEIRFSKILDMIDGKNGLIEYREVNRVEKVSQDRTVNIITKQKICVFGTSGAGKSYVASLLAQITSKRLKLNTLLVDMDIQNAAIDIYNNLTNSSNGLGYLMEEMDRDSFCSEVLKDLTQKSIKNGKLSFITNNMGIYECQNKLSDTYYEKLYKEAENSYDVLLLDLPAAPFLDVVPFSLMKADKIFFVLNPNFISIRQAIKYLDLITNIWKIDKEKIYIIINKEKKESLSANQIKSVLREFPVVLVIKDNNSVEKVINGMEEITIEGVEGIEKMADVFGIEQNNISNKRELKDIISGVINGY